MASDRFFKAGLAIGFAALLTACGHHVQTTSGAQYLAVYDSKTGEAAATDAEIAAAAGVEPQLRFPARIGLAHIDDGRLSPVPAAEAEAWMALARRLGGGFGEFVPVSPLIAALAKPAPVRAEVRQEPWRRYRASLAEVVREIRLGAARQHLDAVLIYETFGESSEHSNPLAVTKIALIGFFLPTEGIEAEGAAQAVLVDVRNGYTYGSATAVSEKPSRRIATVSDSDDAHLAARDEARNRAATALTVEVEAMLRDLRRQLQGDKAASF